MTALTPPDTTHAYLTQLPSLAIAACQPLPGRAVLGHAGPGRAPFVPERSGGGRRVWRQGLAAVVRVEPWTPVISQPWNLPWTALHSETDPLSHTRKHTHTRCDTPLSLVLNLPPACGARLAPAICCALPVDNPCFPKKPHVGPLGY